MGQTALIKPNFGTILSGIRFNIPITMKKTIKHHLEQGFTLLELILYIAIIAIVLTSMSQFAWNVIGVRTKSSTQQEASSTARLISERIKYEIRNADGLNVGTSVFNTNPGTLSLSNPSPDNPTVISVSSGNVQIKYGAASAVSLNPTGTAITDLTFTNYTSGDSKTVHIGFILTVESVSTSARQEYQNSVTLRSSAELRSN